MLRASHRRPQNKGKAGGACPHEGVVIICVKEKTVGGPSTRLSRYASSQRVLSVQAMNYRNSQCTQVDGDLMEGVVHGVSVLRLNVLQPAGVRAGVFNVATVGPCAARSGGVGPAEIHFRQHIIDPGSVHYACHVSRLHTHSWMPAIRRIYSSCIPLPLQRLDSKGSKPCFQGCSTTRSLLPFLFVHCSDILV